MRRDKSKSKYADARSSRAEKQLKMEKIKFHDFIDHISERNQADNKLTESEEIFRVIFDNASDGILLADPETKRFYLGNKTICQKLMYSEEEIKNIWIDDIHTEEALPGVIEEFEKLTRREKELAKDIPIKRKDGSIFYADINSFPVTIAGKQYITGIFRDITETKKMEELLRESECRFRSIFDLSPQAIVLTEFETGKIFDVNSKASEIIGYAKGELLGRTSIEVGFFSDDERNAFIKELKSKTYVYELEKDFRSKDGSVRSFLMFSRIIQIASNNCILSIFIDITERKRVEEELSRYRMRLEQMVKERTADLEKSNEETLLYQKRIEALINSSGDFIFLKDKEFRYLVANKAHEKLFNIKVSDIIGKTDYDFMPKELAEESRKSDETVLMCKDPIESEKSFGDKVLHEIKRRVTDEEGEIIGIAAIIRDITARNYVERELTEAKERCQTLSGSLLRIMEDQRRHIARELHDEIGQQLTVLRLNLLNVRQLSDSKECQKPLNENLAIIESLLQSVRNLSLELRPSILDDLGLVAALRWYVNRLEQETGRTIDFVADLISCRFAPDIENVCFRVAQEALINAIKHSKAKKVGIELRQTENSLQLTIFDDGVGFDAKSALEQAKMGLSFGLLGMQERVSLIGGRITIESTPGNGARIKAYVPLRDDS
jgi:PAS domain S-box-containing protein